MSLQEKPGTATGLTDIPAPRVSAERPADAAHATTVSTTAARVLAVFRYAVGFIFLWAFLDKTFGWGYATPSSRAWIHGGSPTKGFLSSLEAGPFKDTFHSWAGDPWVNWLFMLGLLGVGLAAISGVALRLAALSGTALMAFMWVAEWPLAQHTSAGTPTGSTNPLVDYHVAYALALAVFALVAAGDTWGLGKLWARLPLVERFGWLR